ncbi:MAG: phage terminase large subunit [Pseudorhodoplanes sp.]|nr:phage terminase large subunit [Pseudorhodoplanes sp.]
MQSSNAGYSALSSLVAQQSLDGWRANAQSSSLEVRRPPVQLPPRLTRQCSRSVLRTQRIGNVAATGKRHEGPPKPEDVAGSSSNDGDSWYPQLHDAAIQLAAEFKPNAVLIEDASAGTALAQDIKRIVHVPVKLIRPDHDKIGRVYVQQAKFEQGLVLFPEGAPFLPELLSELLTFPQGRHDDQVDSICQALAFKNFGYDTTFSWL